MRATDGDVELIFEQMRARGCAYTKLAATPFTFDLDHVVVSTVPEPTTGLLGAAAAA